MNNVNIRDQISYSEKGITSKEIMETGKLDSTLFCMAANTNISEHTSTKQGVVYVIEGKGTFNLEGEDIQMLPGVFIHKKTVF